MRKTTFIAGFAAGYLLGTKAGRQRYEQITRTVDSVRSNPTVQRATAVVEHKASEAVDSARRTAADKVSEHLPPSVADRLRPHETPAPVPASAEESIPTSPSGKVGF